MRDAGGEQHEIGEAAAVERKIGDGAFVKESGDGAGLSLDEGGRAGDGDVFESAGYIEAELDFCGCAYVDVKQRSDLRRHILGGDAGGVVAGREEIEGEAAFGVGGGGVERAGSGVDDRDGCAGDAEVVEIDDGAVDGAGGGVLGWGERG